MACISGYAYKFGIVVENGVKGLPPGERWVSGVGESFYVVLRVADNLDQGIHIFVVVVVAVDNFNSPELHVLLKEKIYSVSTLTQNRHRHCPLSSESNLKKKSIDAIEEVTDIVIVVVVCAWYGNKSVLAMSNYLRQNPDSECDLYDRAKKKRVRLTRPAIFAIYNQFTRGVDKADMLISLYKSKCK